MNETNTNDAPKPQGNPVGYKNIELLSADLHQGLGMKPVEHPFAFAKNINAVPVTVNELGFIALSYPIVFTGGDTPTPLAVLGIEKDTNLFLDDKGDWEEFAYVPSYLRRYPFIFAQSDEQDQFLLCFDRDAESLGQDTGQPILEGKELSEYGKQIFEFCKSFQGQLSNTQKFSQILKENDLFANKEITVSFDNTSEPQKIGSFLGVDEDKLRNLPLKKLEELNKSGAWGAIYAHITSLNNWQLLHMRAQAKSQPAQ